MATSAFQIEGGAFEDGKGESIWDRFARDGGMEVDGSVACDHYHQLDTDLDLLADLGVNAYRFSVSWPRVIPDGSGEVNQAGLDFYDRLVDGLCARDIEPWLTIYHWDLPQALQEGGGWANRDTAAHFARYAGVVVKRIGDRVGHWITQNEPWVTAYLGHLYGDFAPGVTDWPTALTVAHHLLVSHGMAADVLREADAGHSVGIAVDCRPAHPATPAAADAEATRVFDGFRNRWFFDPVFGMGYPDDVMRRLHELGRLDGIPPSFVASGDMDLIARPLDFLGLNYYTTLPVAAGADERDDPQLGPGADPPPGFTEMGWAIDPSGLDIYLRHLDDRYSPRSIVVTENGASYSDGPDATGKIHDRRRIDYLRAHIDALMNAKRAGVPVDGYFVWSLLDNLEWTQGFDQRFGLVWVDHSTQERIPKDSFHWYRSVIEADPGSFGGRFIV